MVVMLLSGCAGSAPDFSDRTTGGAAQEAKLADLISQSRATPARSTQLKRIVAPVCATTVPGTPTGWALNRGDWCVIACPQTLAGTEDSRWVSGANERCLARAHSDASVVQVDYQQSDLDLDKQAVFSGLDHAFLANTEWRCQTVRYEIDPDTNLGFWAPGSDSKSGGEIVYRFHSDGRLLSGPDESALALAGGWRIEDGGRVFFNSTQVFAHAVKYSGSQFDDFQQPLLKRECRFIAEAG